MLITGSAILKHTNTQSYSIQFTNPLLLLEEAISKLHAVAQGKPKAEALLDELKLISTSLGFASEYRYWVLICACFNASKEHNIVKTWKDYEKAFLSLVKQDGKVGIKHLL